MNRDFIEIYEAKNSQDLERRLPSYTQASVHISQVSDQQFMAKVKIKGLGKTVSISEVAEDYEQAVRNAKRKALAKAQSHLRKKRGRWRRGYHYEKFLTPVAS